MQQLNRLQNRNDFLVGDVRTGQRREARLPRRVEDVGRSRWTRCVDRRAVARSCGSASATAGGTSIACRASAKGDGNGKDATSGGAEADHALRRRRHRMSWARIARGGWLYFSASPSNATQRYLYRATLDGSAAPGARHASRSARHAQLHAGAGRPPGVPYLVAVRRADGHGRRRAAVPSLAAGLDRSVSAESDSCADVLKPPVEFLTVDDRRRRDARRLDAQAIVVRCVAKVSGDRLHLRRAAVADRGGPLGRPMMLFHRALAEAGYVVVSFDNRGTPAPKGAAWRKVVYGTVGDLSSKEQAAAIRALGGAAFVHRPRPRRHLGLERRRHEHAERDVPVSRRLQGRRVPSRRFPISSSTTRSIRSATWACRRTTPRATASVPPINFAEGLKGKLLVVHGSGDDNVHYQGTERLVNRLIELGKPFDFDGVSEPHPCDLRRARHDGACLSIDRAIFRRTPAGR